MPTPFFLCADGKAHILLSGCRNWHAESPHAILCLVYGRNGVDHMANFGNKEGIQMMCDVNLPITAVYEHISPGQRIPDYGWHGLLQVCICGVYVMRDYVLAPIGKSPTMVARTLLQPILNTYTKRGPPSGENTHARDCKF